ncbi:MAG: 50S ribosomal protein L23, partial [Opitutia bacterium]
MKPASEIISRPVLTEKASGLAEANKYVFEVLPGADRRQIKAAVEAAFKVTVEKVNVLVRKGKVRRSRLGGGAIYTETPSRRAIV